MIEPGIVSVQADGPARVAFTTREGGVSTDAYGTLNLGASSGDAAADVRANRLAVCAALGLDADRVSMCRQVHGARGHEVARPLRLGRFAGGLMGWPAGDALTTDRVALPLLVLGADCLPVLLWRRDVARVAAAHAGWRGLVEGVLEGAARALGEPARAGAVIGPGIGPSRYEVSPEIARQFAHRFGPTVVRTRHVDLAGAARIALVGAGVPAEHITTVPACTYEEPERWFSHRREGPATGRQAGLIWLEDE